MGNWRSTAESPAPVGVQDPTFGRPTEFYNVLSGRWRDGTPVTAAGNGYQTDGPPAQWIFSGNPAASAAWSACHTIQDYRTVLSVRPDSAFAPGQTLTVEYAIMAIEDIPLPCPDAALMAEAAERITETLLAQPVVTSASDVQPAAASLEIYPNPSSAVGFAVRPPIIARGSILTITDATGRPVQRHQLGSEAEATVTGLAPGLYVAAATTPDGRRFLQRVVVQ